MAFGFHMPCARFNFMLGVSGSQYCAVWVMTTKPYIIGGLIRCTGKHSVMCSRVSQCYLQTVLALNVYASQVLYVEGLDR